MACEQLRHAAQGTEFHAFNVDLYQVGQREMVPLDLIVKAVHGDSDKQISFGPLQGAKRIRTSPTEHRPQLVITLLTLKGTTSCDGIISASSLGTNDLKRRPHLPQRNG
jgi:hypothetical protein